MQLTAKSKCVLLRRKAGPTSIKQTPGFKNLWLMILNIFYFTRFGGKMPDLLQSINSLATLKNQVMKLILKIFPVIFVKIYWMWGYITKRLRINSPYTPFNIFSFTCTYSTLRLIWAFVYIDILCSSLTGV